MVRHARSKASLWPVSKIMHSSSPCLRWRLLSFARPLSSPLGITCLNHILEKIIPGMKVLLPLLSLPPVHYEDFQTEE